MINLLPPAEKKALSESQNKKLVMVLVFLVFISLACLSLVIYSLKFYILGDILYQTARLDSAKTTYENPDFLHFKNAITQYNSDVVRIDAFYNQQTYISSVIENVLAIARPKNLYFTNIAFERSGEKVKVSISGTADTRDNLLLFRDNVKSDTSVQNMIIPSESWVKAINPNFEMTFYIRPTKAEITKHVEKAQ